MVLSLRSLLTSVFAAASSYFFFVWEGPLHRVELEAKNVIVTGASRGIGEQIAYHYCRNGANVFLIARNSDALEKVAKQCRSFGKQKVVTHLADLGVAANIPTTVAAFSKNFKQLDHLVLNHKLENHIGPWKGSAQNLTQLENVFDTNYFGYIRLASAAFPLLEKTNGTIGVVSSASGRINTPYLATYSSSKHALDGFFNGWNIELQAADSPVSITFCVLGSIDTDNMRKEIRSFDFANKWALLGGAVDVNATAEAIVKGVTRKRREVYYPWAATRLPLVFRYVTPDLFDTMNGWILGSKYA